MQFVGTRRHVIVVRVSVMTNTAVVYPIALRRTVEMMGVGGVAGAAMAIIRCVRVVTVCVTAPILGLVS